MQLTYTSIIKIISLQIIKEISKTAALKQSPTISKVPSQWDRKVTKTAIIHQKGALMLLNGPMWIQIHVAGEKKVFKNNMQCANGAKVWSWYKAVPFYGVSSLTN